MSDQLATYIFTHPAKKVAERYMPDGLPPSQQAYCKYMTMLGWDAAMASMGQKVSEVSPYKPCPKST